MKKEINMIITNPSENCNNSMNISYHTTLDNTDTFILYRKKYSKTWKKAVLVINKVDVFDNVYSINLDRTDNYERVIFLHCKVTLENLEEDTTYFYKVDGNDEVYSFKTAPKKDFSFIWISDFHTYPICFNRLKNASNLIDKMSKKHNNSDFVFCSGDAIAWGGSYSFWDEFTKIPSIKKYMWANILGNHDYMSRAYQKNTSEYFKEVHNFPENSFHGEFGVCYFFKYAKSLFIVMHNEHMGVGQIVTEEVEKAYEWVEKVINDNPSEHIFLCQHYQWINGVTGNDMSFGYKRWKDICDKYHIDLAIAANDHTYLKTYPIYKDEINNKGTVYMQCPSCDGERGVDINPEINNHKVAYRYANGARTIAGIYVEVKGDFIYTTLYDEKLNTIDSCVMNKKMSNI